VVFYDEQADFKFLTRSTAAAAETIKWEDGQEYPLLKVHISSASQPFYTGEQKELDIEGRIDKFRARQAAGASKKDALGNKAKKAAIKTEKKAAAASLK